MFRKITKPIIIILQGHAKWDAQDHSKINLPIIVWVTRYSVLNSNSNLELTTAIVLIPKATHNHFNTKHINERIDANYIICETVSNSPAAKTSITLQA